MPKGQFTRPKKYNTTLNFDAKINVRINSKKLELLKEIAKQKETSYNNIVRNILDDFLEKETRTNK